jgi:hypothetical protein
LKCISIDINFEEITRAALVKVCKWRIRSAASSCSSKAWYPRTRIPPRPASTYGSTQRLRVEVCIFYEVHGCLRTCGGRSRCVLPQNFLEPLEKQPGQSESKRTDREPAGPEMASQEARVGLITCHCARRPQEIKQCSRGFPSRGKWTSITRLSKWTPKTTKTPDIPHCHRQRAAPNVGSPRGRPSRRRNPESAALARGVSRARSTTP